MLTRAVPVNDLRFNPEKVTERTLEFQDGSTVRYRAYENIFYVANIVDSAYQTLNIYVPESAYNNNRNIPIFLKTNVGGYMAAKASSPTTRDATGRALQEGYIVVIPGSRGSNSVIKGEGGEEIYTGRAPAGLVDLKAAIRYLRYNKEVIPGDTDKIITDGTSAGGAMSALLGATGNNPVYDSYLNEIGAADDQDHIFAAVCFCPITDLDHADMAYEWLYGWMNIQPRGLNPYQVEVSDELQPSFAPYQKSLNLMKPDGTQLTADNYIDYIKYYVAESARKALGQGEEIPVSSGITVIYNGSQEPAIEVDMDKYLEYVVSNKSLKTPPAFDKVNVLTPEASPENRVFGDSNGSAVNFTDTSLRLANDDFSLSISPELVHRVHIMNPMNFIGDGVSKTASHWYIRHGALDRDTAFQIPINLATKLENNGCDVNFELAWGRGHSGDYDLDELFAWIREITGWRR